MNVALEPRCKKCRRPMACVAQIAPIGSDPGLLVVVCTDCGTADSVLVHPEKKRPRSTHDPIMATSGSLG
jgi:hypothetical protein